MDRRAYYFCCGDLRVLLYTQQIDYYYFTHPALPKRDRENTDVDFFLKHIYLCAVVMLKLSIVRHHLNGDASVRLRQSQRVCFAM